MHSGWRIVLKAISITCCFAAALNVTAGRETTVPPSGIREHTPEIHALTNARLVLAPGRVVERGTIVVRDGVVAAAGADVKPPVDATVWDMSGRSVYPGLIDAYAEMPGAEPRREAEEEDAPSGRQGPGTPAVSAGASYWNDQVVPQYRADREYKYDEEKNKKLRAQGITARLLAPTRGIVKGTSAILATGDGGAARLILKERAALHASLTTARSFRDSAGYPTSPMGAMTLFRQAFYDATWYRQAWDAYRRTPGMQRPEQNEALAALQGYSGSTMPVVIDAADELYFLRADQVARELNLNVIVRGSGREYRRLDAVRATGRPIILPLALPETPKVKTPEQAMTAQLADLLHWEHAPENAGRLDAAGVKIAFSAHGLKEPSDFLSAVRKLVDRGLKPESALRALTQTPAELFGLGDRIGTLDSGKSANLIVTSGDLFDKKTKILETWVDGRRYEVDRSVAADVRGTWSVQVAGAEAAACELTLKGELASLSGKLKAGEKSADIKGAFSAASMLTFTLPGDAFDKKGAITASASLIGDRLAGTLLWPDGSRATWTAAKTAPPEEEKPKEAEKKPQMATHRVTFPLGAYGLESRPEQPELVAFTNATVWTSGAAGRLERATVVVRRGKIEAVGAGVAVPKGALVVDLAGKHISPGVIDCHSHMATDGGINESGQAITAEVRIGDFIDPNDITIYRQLAGGVTSANILHGSANPIGGQNQVIKLRWGALPEELKFEGAPPGIKFALGENVKQSNWGERFTTRYPQTRMGVEQLMKDEFSAAVEYRKRWAEWKKNPKGMPPRTDLELETIAEIVEGKRLVHCHSYRQDEILALLRTFESFGIRVASLQHILEGYKVASEIARHGAGASSFSDWWAYKIEVYDAIPYNGGLMHDAGIVVSFNSDSDELGRRLNTEAAKAVKYGGVSEAEALKFVTLNPARQLRIDGRVGSIEVGKDADLAIWSGSPLSTYSVCEQTWIDGRKYFDRGADLEAREDAARIRTEIVQSVLESGEEEPKGKKEGGPGTPPREDIYCAFHGERAGRY